MPPRPFSRRPRHRLRGPPQVVAGLLRRRGEAMNLWPIVIGGLCAGILAVLCYVGIQALEANNARQRRRRREEDEHAAEVQAWREPDPVLIARSPLTYQARHLVDAYGTNPGHRPRHSKGDASLSETQVQFV